MACCDTSGAGVASPVALDAAWIFGLNGAQRHGAWERRVEENPETWICAHRERQATAKHSQNTEIEHVKRIYSLMKSALGKWWCSYSELGATPMSLHLHIAVINQCLEAGHGNPLTRCPQIGLLCL